MMGEHEKPRNDTARGFESDEDRRQTGNLADEKHPVPLFLKGRNDGRQGDAQDEKDETTE